MGPPLYLGIWVFVVGIAAESFLKSRSYPFLLPWGRGGGQCPLGLGKRDSEDTLSHYVTQGMQVTSLSLSFTLYKMSLISQSCHEGGVFTSSDVLCDLGPNFPICA